MSIGIAVQNPKSRSRLPVDRGGAQGDVGARLHMCLRQVSVIHAVELIAAQEEVIFVRALQKIAEVLAHRVCSALVLAGVLRGLLGSKNFNEAAERASKEIAELTLMPFRPHPNKFAALSAHDELVFASGALETCAGLLMKIANDVGWLASALCEASCFVSMATGPRLRSVAAREFLN